MKIVGHRGARGECPENTVASFVHAYQAGIRHFELDVQLSMDGELIVIHDKTTDRTTGHSAKVEELTAKELTALNANRHEPPWYRPTPIPMLTEIIEACPEFESIQFEVKPDSKARLNNVCNRLVELIQRQKLFERSIVTSANTWVIQQIKRLNSRISTGYVAGGRFPSPLAAALKYQCEFLVLNYSLADKNIVADCNEVNVELSCWTVNTLPDIDKLQAAGVRNIITDYPTLVKRYFEENP